MPRPLVPHRRDLILDAARALFHEKGWARTTVSGIAAHATISKGAVYLEFENKAAILDGLIRESSRRLIGQVRSRVLQTDGLVDLAQMYRFGADELLTDPLMRALYLDDASVLGDHLTDVSDGRYRRRVEWLDDYVCHLQRAGVITDSIEPTVIVRMLSTFTIGLVHSPPAMGPSSSQDFSDSIAVFAETINRGLASAEAPDADATLRAQLLFLQRLDDQLADLEDDK